VDLIAGIYDGLLGEDCQREGMDCTGGSNRDFTNKLSILIEILKISIINQFQNPKFEIDNPLEVLWLLYVHRAVKNFL